MKKQAGMSTDTDEIRERFHAMLNTRLETDLEFRDLFVDAAKAMKKGDRSKMRKLFVQAQAAQTMSPNLTAEIPDPPKTEASPDSLIGGSEPGLVSSTPVNKPVKPAPMPVKIVNPSALKKSKTASVAPNVDAWFEKNASAFLSEAQRRFPELLKVARPVPLEQKRSVKGSGATPRQSTLSGGAA